MVYPLILLNGAVIGNWAFYLEENNNNNKKTGKNKKGKQNKSKILVKTILPENLAFNMG